MGLLKQLQGSLDNKLNNSFNMWFKMRIQRIQYYRVYAQNTFSIVFSFKGSFPPLNYLSWTYIIKKINKIKGYVITGRVVPCQLLEQFASQIF